MTGPRRHVRFSRRMFQTEADFPVPEFGDGAQFRLVVERAVNLSDWYTEHQDALLNERDGRKLRVEFFERHVLGWSGFVSEEGEPIEFTDENRRILAEDPDAWMAVFQALLAGTKTITEAEAGN